MSEARELREAGIGSPILVLFDSSEPDALFDLNLTPVLHSTEAALELNKEALRRKTTIGVHMKLNTGMNRMGFESLDKIIEAASLVGLRVEGLMSHFADADLADRTFTSSQLELFNSAITELKNKGHSPLCHMANSAAALSIPEAGFDAVRPGIALYGASPFSDNEMGLRPVMGVKAPVILLRRVKKGQTISYGRIFRAERETLAAVIAAGYADGLPRSLSNNAQFILGGKRAPVAGRICMDLTVLDATGIEGVTEGMEAVILGREGNESITAWELALKAGTIPYEILTGLGRGGDGGNGR